MAVLTSVDLKSRLTVRVLGYCEPEVDQAQDSVAEMNFVELGVSLSWREGEPIERQTRALTWELDELAEACVFMADGQHSAWRSRLLDCDLRLELLRSSERGDAVQVAALLLPGGWPPGFEPEWDEDQLVGETLGVKGLRVEATRSAIGVFAHELEEELKSVPRRMRKRN